MMIAGLSINCTSITPGLCIIQPRFFNNTMDAEDILQEAFITAFKKINTLDNENSFGSWIKRIVVNKSISELRKRKVYFEEINEEIASTVASDVDNDISPQVVNNAVKNLPDDARIIINLNEIIIFLKEELKTLDDMQQEAMTDIEQSGCKKESMNIIYNTYEKRIAILDKIILETRKINAYENKK